MTSRRVYRGGPADGREDADERDWEGIAMGTAEPRQWPIGHYLPTDEYDEQGRRVYEWDGGDRLED